MDLGQVTLRRQMILLQMGQLLIIIVSILYIFLIPQLVEEAEQIQTVEEK